MIPTTLAEVAAATGGRLTAVSDPSTVIDGPVEFDSREIKPGGLFVALSGERVDGHDFVAAALRAGARAALVSREVDASAVVVDDVLVALGRLATSVLERLPRLTVIGITGSSGKTSTKDLVARLLRRLGPTVAPPGSFNNELGHPYTALRVNEQTRYLVLEKSSRGPGHITWLTQIAPPQIGLELNVGTAHVGEFGSLEVTAKAKAELVQALPDAAADGLAVLNRDDPRVAGMATLTAARVVWFGRSADADVQATQVEVDSAGRASFVLRTPSGSAPVTLRLFGEHHVSNALAAAALAGELGMSVADIADALSSADAVSPGRMQVCTRADGVTVVNDAYNANPDSVRAALRALSAMTAKRRWAVLGYMAELGAQAEEQHAEIGREVVRVGIDRLVVVGELARAMDQGARTALQSNIDTMRTAPPERMVQSMRSEWKGKSVHVSDAEAAVRLLTAELSDGDVVLIKASKAAHFGHIVAGLLPNMTGENREGGQA